MMDRLRSQQHRSTTQHTYYVVWKLFNEFFIKLDKKPKNWSDRITLFVGYLIGQGRKSTTIKSYISAKKAVLKINKIRISTDAYLLSSLTKACKLVNDKVRTKLPIRKHTLMVMVKNINRLCTKPF